MANKGRLIGIGLGPGDSELVTIKAVNTIKHCRVLCYPATTNGESIARQIAAPYINHRPIEHPILIPMTPDFGPAEKAYDKATIDIRRYLDDGLDVGILCEGDPLFYGSFMYLLNRLQSDYEVDVIAGVTSLTACAAEVPMPLCARNEAICIVPAPLDDERIRRILNLTDAAAIIKLGRHFSRIKRLLRDEGLIDRCYFIERATLPNQRAMPLEKTGDTAPYFSMILFQRRGVAWQR